MSLDFNIQQNFNLPPEVITHVCSFLPVSSLAQASLVSRVWYGVVQDVCKKLCADKGWKKASQLKGWPYQLKFNTHFSSKALLERRPSLKKVGEIRLESTQLNAQDKTKYLHQDLVIHGNSVSLLYWVRGEEKFYSGKFRLTTWNLDDGKHIQSSIFEDELTCAMESTKIFTVTGLQNESYEAEAVHEYIKVKEGDWISIYFKGYRVLLFDSKEEALELSADCLSHVPLRYAGHLIECERPVFAFNDRFVVLGNRVFSKNLTEKNFHLNIRESITCLALQENILAIRCRGKSNSIIVVDLDTQEQKQWDGFALTNHQDSTYGILETLRWEGCILTLTALVSKGSITTLQWDFSPEKKPAYLDSPFVEPVD